MRKNKIRILVYPLATNPYQKLLYGKLDSKKYKYLFIGTNSFFWLWFGFIFTLALYRVKGFRIFHLHWIYPFSFGTTKIIINRIINTIHIIYFIAVLKMLRFSLVWTPHNIKPHETQFVDDLGVGRFISSRANAVIAHSESEKREMRKIGFNINNVHIIAHGNYIDYYPHNGNKVIKDKIFTYLFFGQVRPYKGIIELIKTYQNTGGLDGYSRLMIVGKCLNPVYNYKIMKIIKEKNSSVIYHNYSVPDRDVAGIFSDADIVVLPYLNVTNSGSAILSFSLKKPIIVPRSGAFSDIPGNLGFFFDPTGSNNLKNALIAAYRNRNKIKKMGQNAYEYVSGLDWSDSALKLSRIYKSLT